MLQKLFYWFILPSICTLLYACNINRTTYNFSTEIQTFKEKSFNEMYDFIIKNHKNNTTAYRPDSIVVDYKSANATNSMIPTIHSMVYHFKNDHVEKMSGWFTADNGVSYTFMEDVYGNKEIKEIPK